MYEYSIGLGTSKDKVCYPIIDAVYTWVNGSDEVWLKDMQKYKAQFYMEHNITNADPSDTSTTSNRFRDNEELKYSLRSLEVNAPWIRHIYIVTNGQIPEWLDTSNTRISIVTHKEIYRNADDLPTFSSPSIEWNLHHIPGLSEFFIYFNDDVFLGRPVFPYDFMTLQRGQMLFGSWETPRCSDRCSYSKLGDGICDMECNNPSCFYDIDDCGYTPIRASTDQFPSSSQAYSVEGVNPKRICEDSVIKGCNTTLLHNNVCNEECNLKELFYDGFDCVQESIPMVDPLPPVCYDNLNEKDRKKMATYIKKVFSIESKSICYSRVILSDSNAAYHIRLGDDIESIENTYGFSLLHFHFIREQGVLFILLHKSYLAGSSKAYFLLEHKNTTSLHLLEVNWMFYPSTLFSYPSLYAAVSSSRIQYTPLYRTQYHASFLPYNYLPVSHMAITNFFFSVNNAGYCINGSSQYQHPIYENGIISIVYSTVDALIDYDAPSFRFSTYLKNTMSFEGSVVFEDPAYQYIIHYNNKREMQTLDVIPTPLMRSVLSVEEYKSMVNFNAPMFESLEHYLNNRKGYFGLEGDVMQKVLYSDPIDQVESCRQAYKVMYNNSTLIPYTATVTYWKESYDVYRVTSQKDEFWSLVSALRIYDLFDNENEIWQTVDTNRKSMNDSVVIAFPAIVSVKCRIVQTDSITKEIHTNQLSSARYEYEEKRMMDGDNGVLLSVKNDEMKAAMKEKQVGERNGMRLSSLSSGRGLREKESPPLESLLQDVYNAENRRNLEDAYGVASIADLCAYFNTTESTKDGASPRRLADTYRNSLVFTNLQVIKLFGNADRRVPAHMPHLIQKSVLFDIEKQLEPIVNETIHHRFREDRDLQFSYLYFHWLYGIEQSKEEEWLEIIWNTHLDVDHDGVLNERELATLCDIVYNSMNREDMEELISCLQPGSIYRESLYTSPNNDLYKHRSTQLNITYASLGNCKRVVTSLSSLFRFIPHIETVSDKDVAFQMIGDNPTDTAQQLFSVRSRKSKFVCINDNISNKTETLQSIIHDFYDSFFPTPSQFEKRKYHLKRRIAIMFSKIEKVDDTYLYVLLVVLLIILYQLIHYLIHFDKYGDKETQTEEMV